MKLKSQYQLKNKKWELVGLICESCGKKLNRAIDGIVKIHMDECKKLPKIDDQESDTQ